MYWELRINTKEAACVSATSDKYRKIATVIPEVIFQCIFHCLDLVPA